MKLSFQESYDLTYTQLGEETALSMVATYLVAEAYASDLAAAKSIIGAMSQEWYIDILSEMRAVGKAGAYAGDEGGKYGEKNQAIGGGWIGKQGGIGANKKEKNDLKADDRRAAKQKAQAEKDRNASRGVSKSARRERAAANKDKKAYGKLDDLLKDIRS
jgi:hypothetical protein